MNYQDKTKEDLIIELNKLNKEYESLKGLYDKSVHDYNVISKNLDKTNFSLTESENIYRNIVDFSTSIILEWDTEGNILYLNKYGLDFFGFKAEEIIGKNVLGTIVEPKDSEGNDLKSKMEVVQKNPEKFYSSENENIKKNGEKVWIAWTNKGIYNSDNQLTKTLSVGIDRTQQREMEKELNIYQNQLEKLIFERSKELLDTNQNLILAKQIAEQNEIRLKGIFNNMLDAYFQVDLNGIITYANPIAQSMYRYSSINEIIGLPAASLYAVKEERDELIKDLQKYGKKIDWNGKGLKKDGTTFWASMNAQVIKDKDGKIIGTEGVARDITERKLIEEQLNESQTLLKSILNSTNDMIWSVDAENFGLLNWNNALQDYFLNERKIKIDVGMTPEDLFPKGSEYIQFWKDMYKNTLANGFLLKEYRTFTRTNILKINFKLLKKEGKSYGISIFARDITEKKQADKEIELSKNQFQEVIENSIDASYKRNLQTNSYDYLSPVFEKLTGYTQYEMNNLPLEKVVAMIHPDDLFETNRIISNAISNPESIPYQIIYRFKHKEKTSYLWILDKFKVIHNDQGIPLAMIGSVSDITQRIQAEQALEASKNFLDKIINSVASPIFVKDDKHRFILINNALCSLLGLPAEKLIGNTGYEHFTKEQMDVYIAKDQEVFETGKENINEETATNALGEIRNILTIKTLYIDNSGNKFLVGVISDITDRKIYELELISAKEKAEDNERRYSLLLNNLEAGIVVHAKDSSIIMCNKRSLELLGLSEKQMIGKIAKDPYWKFIDVNNKPIDINDFPVMRIINEEKAIKNLIFGVYRKKDDIVWLMVNGFPILKNNNEISEIIISFIDITEQKLAEQELISSKEKAEESDRLKTAFLNNISHEIRTPLNGILGFAPMVIEPDTTDEEKKEYLNILDKSCQRLLNTVTDYMDISLIVSANMKVNINEVNCFNLTENLYHKFIQICQEKQLEFNIQHANIPEDIVFKTDEELLSKVLTHLLSNAIKFTPKGKITMGYEFKNNKIEFYVSDSGVGINKDVQNKIFETFMQENISNTRGYEGSGLGLSIVNGITKLLGGKLKMASEKFLGTTVFITLDTEKNTEFHSFRERNKIEQINKLPLVIIAEDDDYSFQYLEIIMKEFSNKIIRAYDGKEAVEICKKNPSANLLLMDIKMPVLNGYEATKEIRKFNKNIIIIAQTAFALTGDKYKSLDVGCNDYISKPIKKTYIQELIKKYFK